MMHAVMVEAVATARLDDLDDLARSMWAAFAAGLLDEGQAQGLADAIAARRQARPGPRPPATRRGTIFPPRRKQPRPDRAASRARRRALAAAGPLPPALAAHFTQGEAAALKVIGDDVRREGSCDRSLAEIAARAGVGRTTVQNALRQAVALGLVSVQARPRRGQRSDTNVVRIVSAEWLTWIRKGSALGSKFPTPRSEKKITKVAKGFSGPHKVCRMPYYPLDFGLEQSERLVIATAAHGARHDRHLHHPL